VLRNILETSTGSQLVLDLLHDEVGKLFHSLRCSTHADKLYFAKHFGQIVGFGSQSQVVKNIFLHLGDVGIAEADGRLLQDKLYLDIVTGDLEYSDNSYHFGASIFGERPVR
jgi:hypothetical protein